MRLPYLTTSLASDVRRTIVLIPIWWLLGVAAFVYHLIAMWLFVKLLASKRPLRGGRVPLLALGPFIAVYAVSLAVNADEAGVQRLLGSVYNFSFWIMGLLVAIVVASSMRVDDLVRLYRPLCWVAIVAGVVSLVALAAWAMGLETLEFPAALGLAIGTTDIPILDFSTSVRILVKDWFAGQSVPRAAALNLYATALAATMLIALPFIFHVGRLQRGRLFRVLALTLGSIAFVLALSRTSFLGLAVGAVVAATIVGRYRVVLSAMALAALVILLPLVGALVSWFLELREGSALHRMEMYAFAADLTLGHNPLVGLGIKPRLVGFHIPIGSHSMYLGALVKTGILGLLTFVIWQAAVLLSWLWLAVRVSDPVSRALAAASGTTLVAFAVWMFGEDLDAPQLVCFLYFLQIGALCVLMRAVDGQQASVSQSRRQPNMPLPHTTSLG